MPRVAIVSGSLKSEQVSRLTENGSCDGHLQNNESDKRGRQKGVMELSKVKGTHSVVSRGSSTEFIQDNERARTSLGQNLGTVKDCNRTLACSAASSNQVRDVRTIRRAQP